MVPRDVVDVAAPHPAAEELGVVLRVRAAVETVDENMAAKHLLRSLYGPHVHRHPLDADASVQVVDDVHGMI
jgi:hypothetical protein